MRGIKGLATAGVTGLAVVLSLGLTACSQHKSVFEPNKPLLQSNQIYVAPAQTYLLDLSSAALAGNLKLEKSCAPEGNSLAINDQLGRHYRIDVINLNNNPKFPNAQTASLQELTEQVYQSYVTRYDAFSQGNTHMVRSPIGEADYRMLYLRTYMSPVGLLITRRGDYAYVLQHVQSYLNQPLMKFNLGELARNMQIPGRQIKDPKSGKMVSVVTPSEQAISIDLAQSTSAQLNAWKKAAHCL